MEETQWKELNCTELKRSEPRMLILSFNTMACESFKINAVCEFSNLAHMVPIFGLLKQQFVKFTHLDSGCVG